MLIHQFATELDKSLLEETLRDANVPVMVVKGDVWTVEKGFIFVSCTLTLSRVPYTHKERRFSNRYSKIQPLLA